MCVVVCVVVCPQPPFVASRASDSYMFGVLLWEMFESVKSPDCCRPWGRAASRSDILARLGRGTWDRVLARLSLLSV